MHISVVLPPGDELPSVLKADNPAAEIFAVEQGGARMVACVLAGRCSVFYVGDCTPEQKIALFAKVKYRADQTPVDTLLIDFSLFTGVIDWGYSKQQKNAAPGLDPPPKKVAYVASNDIAAMFARAILQYSEQEWRVFTERSGAAAWLGWA